MRFGEGPTMRPQLSVPARLVHVLELIEALRAEQAWLEDALGGDCANAESPDARRRRVLDKLNTIADVAAYAKVSRKTVERAISKGTLQSVHLGEGTRQSVRVTEGAVRDWLGAAEPANRAPPYGE